MLGCLLLVSTCQLNHPKLGDTNLQLPMVSQGFRCLFLMVLSPFRGTSDSLWRGVRPKRNSGVRLLILRITRASSSSIRQWGVHVDSEGRENWNLAFWSHEPTKTNRTECIHQIHRMPNPSEPWFNVFLLPWEPWPPQHASRSAPYVWHETWLGHMSRACILHTHVVCVISQVMS